MKEVYSPETLAERWGCSARHVRKIIAKGDLPAFKIGNMLRIPRDKGIAHIAGNVNGFSFPPQIDEPAAVALEAEAAHV